MRFALLDGKKTEANLIGFKRSFDNAYIEVNETKE